MPAGSTWSRRRTVRSIRREIGDSLFDGQRRKARFFDEHRC